MPTREEIAQSFIDVMISDLEVEVDEVNLAGTFEDHLIFSMDTVYLIATVLKIHQIKVPKEEFKGMVVLDDIIDLIMAHVD